MVVLVEDNKANAMTLFEKCCPTCSLSNIQSSVSLVQLNLREAMWMCNNLECSYPFNNEEISNFIVLRDYREMPLKFNGRSSASSISSKRSQRSSTSSSSLSQATDQICVPYIKKSVFQPSTVKNKLASNKIVDPSAIISSEGMFPGYSKTALVEPPTSSIAPNHVTSYNTKESDVQATEPQLSKSSSGRESSSTPSIVNSSTPCNGSICSEVSSMPEDMEYLNSLDLGETLDALHSFTDDSFHNFASTSSSTSSVKDNSVSEATSILDELSEILGDGTGISGSSGTKESMSVQSGEFLDAAKSPSDSSGLESLDWDVLHNLPGTNSAPTNLFTSDRSWDQLIKLGCQVILMHYGQTQSDVGDALTSVKGHWKISCSHCQADTHSESVSQCPFTVSNVSLDGLDITRPRITTACSQCSAPASATLLWDSQLPPVLCCSIPCGLNDNLMNSLYSCPLPHQSHVFRLAMVVELTTDSQLDAWVKDPKSNEWKRLDSDSVGSSLAPDPSRVRLVMSVCPTLLASTTDHPHPPSAFVPQGQSKQSRVALSSKVVKVRSKANRTIARKGLKNETILTISQLGQELLGKRPEVPTAGHNVEHQMRSKDYSRSSSATGYLQSRVSVSQTKEFMPKKQRMIQLIQQIKSGQNKG